MSMPPGAADLGREFSEAVDGFWLVPKLACDGFWLVARLAFVDVRERRLAELPELRSWCARFWFCNIFWMSLSSALSSLRGRISPCTPVVTPGHAHVADMVMVGGVATAESLSWQSEDMEPSDLQRTYSFRKEATATALHAHGPPRLGQHDKADRVPLR